MAQVDEDEPISFDEVISLSVNDKWIAAVQDEINSMDKNTI